MKRFLAVGFWLLAFCLSAQAQNPWYARRIFSMAALPATCNPLNGEIIHLTAGDTGLYQCIVANTWARVGLTYTAAGGNQIKLANGTAAHPSLSFVAEETGLYLSGAGDLGFSAAGVRVAALRGPGLALPVAAAYYWDGQSKIFSAADSRINLTDQAGATFARLTLGPEAVTHPSIIPTAAVAGQTQGISIRKGDGTTVLFADLGAAANGALAWCSDCNTVNIAACTGAALGNCVCAAGGAGKYAKRVDGAWYCALY